MSCLDMPYHLITEFIMKCEPLAFNRLGVCEFCGTGREFPYPKFPKSWRAKLHLDSCIFARAKKAATSDGQREDQAKALKAMNLWRRYFEFAGDEPWVDDDYGATDCFFCGNNKDEGHAMDCVHEEAKRLLNWEDRPGK